MLLPLHMLGLLLPYGTGGAAVRGKAGNRPDRYSLTLEDRVLVFDSLEDLWDYIASHEQRIEEKIEQKAERAARRVVSRRGKAVVKTYPPLQIKVKGAPVPELGEWVRRMEALYRDALQNALVRVAEEDDEIALIAAIAGEL